MVDEVTDAVAEAGDTSETETQQSEQTAKTVLSGDDKGSSEAQEFDWRSAMAGGDEKELQQISRYTSLAEVWKAKRASDKKISSGDLKSTLPADATEEQIAAYRKDNGIPDTPDGYLESLPDGLVIGDEDKDKVQSYVERVHGKNADPAIVAESLAWYQELKENAIADQAEADKATLQANEDILRAEWGGEFRPNINSIKSLLDTAPDADDGTPLKELIFGARLADGTHMGNHPAMMKWMAKLANDANPAGFVSPGSGLSQIQSVEDEIAEIDKLMRTNRAAYNKDEKKQARYLQLLGAREKLQANA